MAFEKSVIFACGKEEYAISVEEVISIEKLSRITPIPQLPNYLLGFTKVRGELIPVIDFNQILYNLPSQGNSCRMIVLNTDVVKCGLVVSEAKEILNLAEKEIKQAGLVNYLKTRYFTAVANLGDRMIVCVDSKILVNSLEGIREIVAYLHKLQEEENNEVNA